jgi:secondary thiamine-phosphate synthase enzyme
MMQWIQRELRLPSRPPGCHLITDDVVGAIDELRRCRVGWLHIFLLHTSASLTINENADPDVPRDLETSLQRLAPETAPYRHTVEGPDDMPAHVKSSLLGCSLLIPVRDGQLVLGTWQGIYLCEHRRRASPRRLMLTLCGEWATEPNG